MTRHKRLTTLAALLALAALPVSALAQGLTSVGVVTTLTGQATVARASLPQPLPLRFKDDVFLRDRISTAEKSIVRVLLGGKALVTARELSVLTITEEMGRSTVELGSGKIAVGVARQRMRPGEIVEIRTPNVVAAVRGTVLVVEIIRSSADSNGGATPPTTNVHVIHGLVDVFPSGAPGALPVQVATLQTYSRIGSATGTLRNLSREAAENLFADLRSEPQFSENPGKVMDGVYQRELERATALAHAILPDSGSGGGGPGGGDQPSGGPRRDDLRVTENRDACSHGACDPSSGSNGQGGGSASKSGNALTTYSGQTRNFAGNFYSVPNGGVAILNQPLLETTASILNVGGSLIDVKGFLAAIDPNNPFVYLDPTISSASSLLTLRAGGIFAAANTLVKDVGGSLTVSGNVFDIAGNSTLATVTAAAALSLDGSTLANGTGTLMSANGVVFLGGPLLEEKNGAQVTTQQAAKVNAALLAASAPLLSLTGKSVFTSSVDAVDLASVNKATQFASLAKLDASTFTVKVGAALNLTGGSVVTVLGDLFTLANQSTLKILSGPLVSLSGNSSLNITGALLNFLGTGNTVTVTNSLCAGACPIVMGIPVFVTGGGAVSLTNPIKGPAGNSITYSSASAALISVSGAKSQVTVQGN